MEGDPLCGCYPITHLESLVRKHARVPAGVPVNAQTEYLRSYLTDEAVGARSILVETDYVDRHYIEEFSGYYATAFDPPPAKATRLHFFKTAPGSNAIEVALRGVAAGRTYDEVVDDLRCAYVGFAVIRPLPAAPIGRTAVKPYEGDGARSYAPARVRQNVHLAGFEMAFDSLPFQQQDQAVGACATTALWSALARVMRADGHRAPTPLAVTRAATAGTGRGLPAHEGLSIEHMAAAVRSFGYSPHVLAPAQSPGLFLLTVATYLRSGIPVVLLARFAGELHAITLTGFRAHEGEELLDVELAVADSEEEVKEHLLTPKFVRLYAHDDRLGPYARLKWVEQEDEIPEVVIQPRGDFAERFKWVTTPGVVNNALAALYPKLRLSARDLIDAAVALLPATRKLLEPSNSVRVELRFELGGAYQRELLTRRLDMPRLHAALSVKLPRYVGIVRFATVDGWLADAVIDTSDIWRGSVAYRQVLALIPREPVAASRIEAAGRKGLRVI